MRTAGFDPLPFLHGPHRQTLAGAWSWKREPLSGTETFRVPLGGGDATTLHTHVPTSASPDSPTLLLIHGLEGDACRPYMIRIAQKAARVGLRTARMNLRWCGDAEGMSSKFYNSAQSGDVRKVCEWLRKKNPASPLWVAGFSLGGNLALKMAGERGTEGLAGVVAVSPPIDLHVTARSILQPQNRFYQWRFVKTIVARSRRFLQRVDPSLCIPLSTRMTLVRFDEVFTVPLGGFSSLDHYYDEGSPKRLLPNVPCPTFVIASKDDPLVPFEVFSGIDGRVRLIATRRGGHLGFVGRANPGDPDSRWAENRLLQLVTEDRRTPGVVE